MCTQRAGQVAAHLEGIGGGSNTGSLASEDALDPQPCGGESRPLVSQNSHERGGRNFFLQGRRLGGLRAVLAVPSVVPVLVLQDSTLYRQQVV